MGRRPTRRIGAITRSPPPVARISPRRRIRSFAVTPRGGTLVSAPLQRRRCCRRPIPGQGARDDDAERRWQRSVHIRSPASEGHRQPGRDGRAWLGIARGRARALFHRALCQLSGRARARGSSPSTDSENPDQRTTAYRAHAKSTFCASSSSFSSSRRGSSGAPAPRVTGAIIRITSSSRPMSAN